MYGQRCIVPSCPMPSRSLEQRSLIPLPRSRERERVYASVTTRNTSRRGVTCSRQRACGPAGCILSSQRTHGGSVVCSTSGFHAELAVNVCPGFPGQYMRSDGKENRSYIIVDRTRWLKPLNLLNGLNRPTKKHPIWRTYHRSMPVMFRSPKSECAAKVLLV